ncbi:hypothetical protein ACFL35_03750 [Candidatus Riflebacteria bacterium]
MGEKFSVSAILDNIQNQLPFFCSKLNSYFGSYSKFTLLEKNAPLRNNKLSVDLLLKDHGRPFKYYVIEFYFPHDLRTKPKISTLKSQFAKEKGVDPERIEGIVIYCTEHLGSRFNLEKTKEKAIGNWIEFSADESARLLKDQKGRREEFRKPEPAKEPEKPVERDDSVNDSTSVIDKESKQSEELTESSGENKEKEPEATERSISLPDDHEKTTDKSQSREPLILSKVRSGQDKQDKRVRKVSSESQMEDSLIVLVKDNVLPILVKRKDRYLRKGLWTWIDKGAHEEDYHFFLAIFNCIYQEKAVDKLLSKFTTINQIFEGVEEVVELLLEAEENLPKWVVQDIDAHSRKITKLISCFAKMRPITFIKETFEREMLRSSDSYQARISVFHMLSNLLTKCGYSGERENQHVLEILYEIGICRGYIEIDYAQNRTINALTKLKLHFPDIEWNAEKIEPLRGKIAKKLGLEVKDFNLSLFIPKVSTGPSHLRRRSGYYHPSNFRNRSGGRRSYNKRRKYY